MMDDVVYSVLTYRPEETIAFGAALACVLQPGDIIVLTGDLGAGKTQFAKGIAQGLGIVETVTSPTFNIMLVYEGSNGQRLNHLDLYRLDAPAQLDDIDYFGCLESDAVSVVEWGDKFADALPLGYLEVSLELVLPEAGRGAPEAGCGGHPEMSDDARVIRAVAHGARAARMLETWRAENASILAENALACAEDTLVYAKCAEGGAPRREEPHHR